MENKNNNIKQKQDFLYNVLTSDNVVETIRENLDVLIKLIPEIKPMIGFDHRHPKHHLDVWEHTLLALKNSVNDFDIRLTLLFHDIGKPLTCTEDVTRVRHFHGHGDASENIVRNFLKSLEYDKEYIDEICYMVKNHDNKIEEKTLQKNYPMAKKLLEVQRCDIYAHNPSTLNETDKKIIYFKKISEIFKNFEKSLKQNIKA